MSDLRDRVIIVTGATGNLGQAVAEACRAAGAKLVLVDRGVGRLAKTFPELEGSPDHTFAESIDLAVPGQLETALKAAREQHGQFDGLVNTVGGYRPGSPVHETPVESWQGYLDLNAKPAFIACRAVVPHMLEASRGRIVNVSARAALSGRANQAAYSASKAAVIRLTESLSAEVKNHGINVNCVLPGTIDTPENRAATPDADFSRWVPPEAIASVIVFLLSDAAGAIHGASIPVYGLS